MADSGSAALPPSPPLATGPRLARNVAFGVGSQAWTIVLSLVTIRIVIHGLGADAYGVFVIATLLLGYGAFLDLGLTAALIRSIAVHHALSDRQTLERIIGTAFAALLVLGAAGGLLLIVLTPAIVSDLLHIPPGLQGDARVVFYLAAFAFAINMALIVFAAVPQGLQRLDLLSVRTVLLTTLTAAGQIAVIELHGGLRWLAIVSFASNVASLAAFAVLAPRLLPNTSFRPQLSRAALNELTGFGAKRFISQAGVQAIFQLDRIIVGAFLPIRAVTFYSVPLSITQRFLVFHGSITNTYFPAASELHGLRDTDRLRRLYTTTFKLNAALMLLLVALIASLARPMLDAWLGADFARSSATILVVLAFGYGLTALVGLGGQLSDASGHPGWTATYVVASALTNIILSILLVPRVGAVGAAYALLLQNLVCGVSFLAFSQWRLLHISMVGSLALLIRPLIAAGVVAAAGLAAGSLLHGVLPVIGALLLGTAIYAGLTLVLGTWTQRERRLAKDALLAIFP